MLAWCPNSADWGNVAEWAAAVGGSLALVFAFLGWRDTRNVMKEEFAARDAVRLAEAQRVTFQMTRTTVAPDGASFEVDGWPTLLITNGSTTGIDLSVDYADPERERTLIVGGSTFLQPGKSHSLYVPERTRSWSAKFTDIRGFEWIAHERAPVPVAAKSAQDPFVGFELRI